MTSYRAVCTSHAVAAVVGGILVVLLAPVLLELFGLAATPSSALALRMFGGILFGLGGTLAVAREITELTARARLVQANLVCDVMLALTIGGSAYAHVGSGLLWGLAGLFAINAVSWVMVLARGSA